jgi:hypothetical protein
MLKRKGKKKGEKKSNLLVCENKKHSIPQLILIQHAVQLVASLCCTVSVVRIDDENETLSILEVMAPEGADLVLTTCLM